MTGSSPRSVRPPLVCLPITAKLDAMPAPLPFGNIIQVIAPAKNGCVPGSPNEQVRLHGNRGRAHSRAHRTIRRLRRLAGRTNEEIGKAQIVYEHSSQLRRQSQNALVTAMQELGGVGGPI